MRLWMTLTVLVLTGCMSTQEVAEDDCRELGYLSASEAEWRQCVLTRMGANEQNRWSYPPIPVP